MAHPSTFSIVAYDPGENTWGVAVASKFLGVGAIVPWAQAGAGAVATQALANTSYGLRGLEMMSQGKTAAETLAVLLAEDDQSAHRQVGLVDARGGSATFTGSACYDWAGGVSGPNFAVQGNILTGEKVVQAMAQTFRSLQGNLTWRLYHALYAGDREGGDRRGRQSAAILVVKPGGGYGGFTDRLADYRVDDHPDPVQRLGQILELHDLYFGKSPAEDQVELSGDPLARLQEILNRLGYYAGEANGQLDPPTRNALEAFLGNENFEERVDFTANRIDRPVFEYLSHHYGA